eukprot:6054040-Amphidinium_carterae.1
MVALPMVLHAPQKGSYENERRNTPAPQPGEVPLSDMAFTCERPHHEFQHTYVALIQKAAEE